MRRDRPRTLAYHLPLIFPAAMLVVFCVCPFGTMIAVSFFRRQQVGFYSVDFVFDNYERFLIAFFGGVLGFSLLLAAVVAVCCVVLAFPFTYFLSCRARRVQVAWLVAQIGRASCRERVCQYV